MFSPTQAKSQQVKGLGMLQDFKRVAGFWRWWILYVVLTLTAASGCGKDSDQEPALVSRTENSASVSVPGGMAVIALSGDPDVLNPLIRRSAEAGQVLAEILDTLTELDEDLIHRPRIADHWVLAADSLSLTYTLKPWLWEDGQPLAARDVATTFQLFKNPLVASPSRGFYVDVESVEVIDSKTLRYNFSAILPDPIARTAHAILPWHRLRELDPSLVNGWSLNQAPLSSGPFRLVSWEHARELLLERNELYPYTPAMLDRISFRIIKEPAARVLSLESGEVDFVSGVSSDDARRLQQHEDLKVMGTGGRRFYYLMWNCHKSRFTDSKTRRALSFAIDRERMIQTLLGGYGDPAFSPVAQVVWNYAATLSADAFDPERAAAMLESAGWRDTNGDGVLDRNGESLEFEILTRQADPVRTNGVVILRENFAAVGALVKVRALELASGLALLRSGDFDAYFGAMNPNLYGDPSSAVHSDSIDEYNNGFYSNAVVDSLLAVARGETERSLAMATWVRLQEELQADPPAAYLFIPQRLDVVSRRLQNVRPHVLSPFNNLAEWWIAPSDRKYRTGAAVR